MTFTNKDFDFINNNTDKHFMEKCHLSVSFNSIKDQKKEKENNDHILNFCEDETIEKPKFIKGVDIEHTLKSRWITPCNVVNRPTSLPGSHYTAYYHPQTYILAKNLDFRHIIIEHAIKRVCDNGYTPSYSIVQSPINNVLKAPPVRPRYELCLFSSRLCPQQYFQLNVWLPDIISVNSIVVECSVTNILIQTERPANYELTLKWPHQLIGHKIIFCVFIKKQKKLVIVAEKLNFIEESEEETPQIPLCTTLALESLVDENSLLEHDLCSPGNDQLSENECETGVVFGNGEKKKKKHLKVSFNALDFCIVFQDSEAPLDISKRSTTTAPSKIKDGCSTRKYNYQMNKKIKGDRNSQSNTNKPNSKGKRNGRKKK